MRFLIFGLCWKNYGCINLCGCIASLLNEVQKIAMKIFFFLFFWIIKVARNIYYFYIGFQFWVPKWLPRESNITLDYPICLLQTPLWVLESGTAVFMSLPHVRLTCHEGFVLCNIFFGLLVTVVATCDAEPRYLLLNNLLNCYWGCW